MFEPTLDNATSLLEALFALNLAFGIWDGVVAADIKERVERYKAEEDIASAFAEMYERIDEDAELYESKINAVIKRGQRVGLLLAFLILVLLFFAAMFPDFELHGSWFRLALLYISPVVALVPFLWTFCRYRWLLRKWGESISRAEWMMVGQMIKELAKQYKQPREGEASE